MTALPIHNRKQLEERRKYLRKKLTAAEASLWRLIKGNQLEGRKFRRQHSVGRYVLDFYCPSEKVAVELDGAHHFTDEGLAYDKERTQYLNNLKIQVIRFENEQAFQSPNGVLAEIRSHFATEVPFHP